LIQENEMELINELIREGLVSKTAVSEAFVSSSLPKVDGAAGQNTGMSVGTNQPSVQGPVPASAEAMQSTAQQAQQAKDADPQNQQQQNQQRQQERFRKQGECVETCLHLAEYHLGEMTEGRSMSEMESPISERIRMTTEMIKTARQYMGEIKSGSHSQNQNPSGGAVPKQQPADQKNEPNSFQATARS
jgi:hypothetical protein